MRPIEALNHARVTRSLLTSQWGYQCMIRTLLHHIEVAVTVKSRLVLPSFTKCTIGELPKMMHMMYYQIGDWKMVPIFFTVYPLLSRDNKTTF